MYMYMQALSRYSTQSTLHVCPDDETVQMSGGKDRQVQGALNYKDFAQVYTLQFRSLNTYYN